MNLKKLVEKRRKLEAEVGAEVKQEQKVASIKTGKAFEKQMIREEKAKIRHLKVEKKIGKYARKGFGLFQKGKGLVKAGQRAIQKGQKVHGRIGEHISAIQDVADKFQQGRPKPKEKSKKRKGGAFGIDLPF